MPFAIPTERDLREQAYADIETLAVGPDGRPTLEPRRENSVIGAWCIATARQARSFWRFLDHLARMWFADSAEGEYLDRRADIFGVARKPAASATGVIRFTGAPDAPIAPGVQLRTRDGRFYATTAAAVLDADGAAVAPVAAAAPGAAGNAAAGVALTLISPLAFVAAAATVAQGGLSGGADAETDAALRRRLLARMRVRATGANAAAYAQMIEAVGFVDRAFIYPNHIGRGTVGFTFTTNTRTPPIPTQGEVDAVRAHLEGHDDPLTGYATGRAVGADVHGFVPPTRAVDYQIRVAPDTAPVRAAVAAALDDFHGRHHSPGAILRLSQLSAAISAAGGEVHHHLIAPTADIQTGPTTIPILGAIAWEAGG